MNGITTRIQAAILAALSFTLVTAATPAKANPAQCYAAAMAQNIFTEHTYMQVMELCRGTGTAATVECFVRAKAMFRVAPERKAASLCKGAQDLSPLTCYEEAYEQIPDRTQRSKHALQLCSHR